jgi:hypothetical protein
VNYLVRGRYHLLPKHPQILGPDNLSALTSMAGPTQNPDSSELPTAGAGESRLPDTPADESASPGLKEMVAAHE